MTTPVSSHLVGTLRRLDTRRRVAWGAICDAVSWVGSALLPHYRRILPTSARELLPEWLRFAVKRNLKISDAVTRVQHLSVRLNELGFVERARDDLVQLSVRGKAEERRLASWELALWHANQGTPDNAAIALQMLDRALVGRSDAERLRRDAILRAECHASLGATRTAGWALASRLEVAPHPDLYLALANLQQDPAARLARVNEALRCHGLAELALRSDASQALYDRLKAATFLEPAQGPKVTVLMPAFNAANHIRTALEALSEQTWRNLEVLVVDDVSDDATPDIVEAFSIGDPRIRLIRAGANRGSYVARNLGLREATGAFVTTHDADDWSHPQKIEIQARQLMTSPRHVATTSQQARATSALSFHRRGSPGYYIFDNMSSLMFRREPVLNNLGFWDSVRFGADSEYIERIRLVFGRTSIGSLPEKPLSFQRQSESSLTAHQAFGYTGFSMGARLAYHQASRAYHRRSKKFFYAFPQIKRPFAVPEPMLPLSDVIKGSPRLFETILVSDFRIPGQLETRNLAHVKEHTRKAGRVGLVQMASYDFDPTADVLPVFRALEDAGKLEFIVYGETVRCKRLDVIHPHVLEELQRFVPDIEAEKIHVLVEQAPCSLTSAAPLREWLDRCRRNSRRYFARADVWLSNDPKLDKLLAETRNNGNSNMSHRHKPR